MNVDGKDIYITEIRKYSDERVAFKNQEDLWGFLDEKGKVVIKPIYSYVSDFVKGIAFVYNDLKNEYYYIDKDGNQLTKKGYIGTGRIVDGYGIVYKHSTWYGVRLYYLLNSKGEMFLLNKPYGLGKYKSYEDSNMILKNSILIEANHTKARKIDSRPNDYLVNNSFLDYLEPFEKNPVDNKLYAINNYHDDGSYSEGSIYNEEGKKILKYENAYFTRLNEKYIMCKSGDQISVFYLDSELDDGYCIVLNTKKHIKDIEVLSDDILCLSVYTDGINIKTGEYMYKKQLYSIESGNYSEMFDEIIYDKEDDYIVGKNKVIPNIDNDGKVIPNKELEEFVYYDNNMEMIFKTNTYSKIRNGIGLSYSEETCSDSNSSYNYKKYCITYRRDIIIDTFPNEEKDIKFKYLKFVDKFLVGESLFNNKLYIINPDPFSSSPYMTCVEGEYCDYICGCFIIKNAKGYSLIDEFGNDIYKDIYMIDNIGDDNVLAHLSDRYEICDLDGTIYSKGRFINVYKLNGGNKEKTLNRTL